MAYATDVKIFWCDPGMTSVPALSGGTAGRGTLTAILDACLVNGYGLKTADSVTVSGGIATATFSTGHEFGKWQVALVAGATPAALNGEKRLLSATTNAITFDATGVPDGTATGIITVKVAPLGWLKPFGATNKAVYQIDAVKYPEASTQYLRVDDSQYNYCANVALYESMSGVDAGENKTPTVGQAAGGWYLSKSETTGATPRYWALIGDGQGFYFLRHSYGSDTLPNYGAVVNFFGDPITPDTSDPYKFLLSVDSGPGDSVPQPSGGLGVAFNGAPAYLRRARAANRVTRSVALGVAGSVVSAAKNATQVASGSDTYLLAPFPNTQGGGIQLSRLHVSENAGDYAYVGELPGLFFVENRMGSKLHAGRFERIYDSNSPAFPNRVIAYLLTPHSSTQVGVTAFDIVGPWR